MRDRCDVERKWRPGLARAARVDEVLEYFYGLMRIPRVMARNERNGLRGFKSFFGK
jgi:hypothetical protein